MKTRIILNTIATMLLLSGIVSAQDKIIKLAYNPRHFRFDSLPFNKVTVVDGRMDTGLFYIFKDGHYPFRQISIENGLIRSVQAFVDSTMKGKKTANRQLLIKVNSCRVLNMQTIRRQGGHGAFGIGRDSHSRLHFDADVFELGDSGKWKEVVSYNQLVYTYNQTNKLDEFVEKLLSNLMKVVVGRYNSSADSLFMDHNELTLKYREWYHGSLYSLEEIEAFSKRDSVVKKLASFEFPGNGVFNTFDDFLSGNVHETGEILKETISDSLYMFYRRTETGKKPLKCWGVWFRGAYYTEYFGGFLKLDVTDRMVSFHVPSDVLNIYAVFSLQQLYKENQPDGNLPAILLELAVDAITSKQFNKQKDEIYRKGLQSNYRYCVIDPLNGDLLFYDEKP